MLRALELENFKAFGKRTRVTFAPITLIYGPNSAGKSSVLNALNLLKQTRITRDQTALLLPRAERGLVDLGSFHELLHDHDLSRTLVIRLDFESSALRWTSREADDSSLALGFEVGFRRVHNASDVSLSFLRAYAGEPTENLTEPTVQFEPKSLSEREQQELVRYAYAYSPIRSNRFSTQDLKAAACVHITNSRRFWEPHFRAVKEHAVEIVRALESMITDTKRANPPDEKFEDSFNRAILFYGSNFTIEEFIARRRKAELGAVVALDGFLPIPSRFDPTSDYPEYFALRYSRDTRPRRWRFFESSELIFEAGRTFENELDKVFPLGPYRRAPKRLYIFTGTTPSDVGYSGDLLPDLLYRKPQILRETNEWLSRLDIGYRIEIKSVGTPSNDLFEVRLQDTRRTNSSDISLSDVGFGISQILPFIVQTLASREQTITIEQPEVHIHPRLQADLADLLIAGIQRDRHHRFIVETHSEHLVLRLLRRIRETTYGMSPRHELQLTPTDVSVVYLERGPDGVQVHHLRIDEQGEFIDRWPEGFFEERAKELF